MDAIYSSALFTITHEEFASVFTAPSQHGVGLVDLGMLNILICLVLLFPQVM